MSEASRFEITIPVKQASKAAAGTFYTVWGVLGVAVSYMLFDIANALANQVPAFGLQIHLAQVVLGLIGGLLYVYIPYQIALARAQETTILINEAGFSLPPTFFGLGPPRWVPWLEVQNLRIDKQVFGLGEKCLSFHGKWRAESLPLSAVSPEDMQQMLLAVEAWAPSAVWSSAVNDFRDVLQLESYGEDGYSHTQMFEDELAKRFSAPTFVPLEPGRQLRSGTIKVIRQLAFGGFAAVYLAEDEVNGRVVLKESVAPSSSREEVVEKARELFAREALLLRGLDHPGIARVYDYFVEDDRSYIVMEYIDGINLRQLVAQQGKQPEHEVLKWAAQIASILAYLHSQSPPVVHRDVSPDNIVLTNLGDVKLIDFGASNQYLGTATGTLVGKHAYMPPEQIRGKAEPASDIFALGATMHFLLTGEEPESLTTSHPATINRRVTAATNDLVAAATTLDVEKRIVSAQALGDRILEASSQLAEELSMRLTG